MRILAKNKQTNTAMSRKLRGELTLCVFIVTAAFCTFRLCDSVSLAEREHGVTDDRAKAQTGDGRRSVHPRKEGQHAGGEEIIQDAPRAESDRPGLQEPGPRPPGSPGESLPSLSMMEPYETDSSFAQNGLSWSFGNTSSHQSPFEDGYQADFPGFSHNSIEGINVMSIHRVASSNNRCVVYL